MKIQKQHLSNENNNNSLVYLSLLYSTRRWFRSSSTVYFLFLFYQKRKKERKKERREEAIAQLDYLNIYIKKALDLSSKGTVESDGQRGWCVNVYISDGEKEAFCRIIFNFR